MSVARRASATTSLPKPAALTPAGTGRSKAARPAASLGRFLTGSFLLPDTLFAQPLPPRGRMSGHPTGLRALTQSGEQFQAGVAIGLHTDLFLEADDRPHRVAPGTAVDVVLETVLVKPPLYFLDLVQGRRALAAGELLAERRIASDQVAEMAQRQRVASGWIVRIDRLEILPQQERRPAGDRQ